MKNSTNNYVHIKKHLIINYEEAKTENDLLFIEKDRVNFGDFSALVKFPCELCDERLESSLDFVLHSIKHSRDHRYHCLYCNASTQYERRIREHLKWKHTFHGRYYQCELCHLFFSDSNMVEEHEHVHYDEDVVYNCTHCKKTFQFSWLLRTHERLVGKPFPCDSCPKSYVKLQGLQAHQQRVHGDS